MRKIWDLFKNAPWWMQLLIVLTAPWWVPLFLIWWIVVLIAD
jgi:hypothetical protein